jgi:hypothetical protein
VHLGDSGQTMMWEGEAQRVLPIADFLPVA